MSDTLTVETKLPKRLYRLEEAAVYLGCTLWSVRELLYAGKIPFLKIGRRNMVAIEDMEMFVSTNKKTFGRN